MNTNHRSKRLLSLLLALCMMLGVMPTASLPMPGAHAPRSSHSSSAAWLNNIRHLNAPYMTNAKALQDRSCRAFVAYGIVSRNSVFNPA